MLNLHSFLADSDVDVIEGGGVKLAGSAFGEEEFVVIDDSLVGDLIFVEIDLTDIASDFLLDLLLFLSFLLVLVLFLFVRH